MVKNDIIIKCDACMKTLLLSSWERHKKSIQHQKKEMEEIQAYGIDEWSTMAPYWELWDKNSRNIHYTRANGKRGGKVIFLQPN